jgi:hypothetical protein
MRHQLWKLSASGSGYRFRNLSCQMEENRWRRENRVREDELFSDFLDTFSLISTINQCSTLSIFDSLKQKGNSRKEYEIIRRPSFMSLE